MLEEKERSKKIRSGKSWLTWGERISFSLIYEAPTWEVTYGPS